ncbi:MAG: fatty acid desaturase [Deltaproteobacteria bacterium]|nr:fatty acid desaturase [Deltaproteobacteria bacterium]
MNNAKESIFSKQPQTQVVDWIAVTFLSMIHLMAVAAIFYTIYIRFSWWTVVLTLIYWACSAISITGGYHRLFSHSTYKAHPWLELFYLIFGASAVQNSALKWSMDHRRHHAVTDQEDDPYSVKKGFWWSHFIWVLFKTPHSQNIKATDLKNNPRVMWQYRNYVPLLVTTTFIIPPLLGWIWGDPLGALLWVAGLRLVFLYHSTWCINSLAHTIGSRPYSKKTTARDSAITAIFALGEGYHNFHHTFQSDYRNGIKWYQYDPTKWFVSSMEKVGLTRDLRRTPEKLIENAKQTTN